MVVEHVDRSQVNPASVLDDIMVTLDSWEYPIYFLVIQPKTNMEGHPVILGRPWLAITHAFISCRFGEMTISNGLAMKKLILYPPTKPILGDPLWVQESCENAEIESSKKEEIKNHKNAEILHPLLTIE